MKYQSRENVETTTTRVEHFFSLHFLSLAFILLQTTPRHRIGPDPESGSRCLSPPTLRLPTRACDTSSAVHVEQFISRHADAQPYQARSIWPYWSWTKRGLPAWAWGFGLWKPGRSTEGMGRGRRRGWLCRPGLAGGMGARHRLIGCMTGALGGEALSGMGDGGSEDAGDSGLEAA